MSSSGQKHVCFYSNRCRWSKAFIDELKQTPYVNEVQFICVDPTPDGKRPQIPRWLKQVPTLVIRGEDEPRTDGEVMNWLSERRMMDGKQQSDEWQAWTPGEMGGSLTKSYSLIQGDSEDAPEGNFQYLHGANGMATRTASDMPGGGLGARGQNKNKKEQLFDSQMEQYMKQRDMGMPPPVMRQ